MQRLFERVDNSTLALTRIGFGLIMAWQIALMLGTSVASDRYQEPLLTFHYPGLEWLVRLPEPGMIALFWVTLLAALGIAAGLAFRVSAAVFLVAFGYLQLHDQTVYSNLSYLVLLVGFWLALSPAAGAWSLDAKWFPKTRSSTTPRLFPWMLRFQVAVAYFYGGIVKFNPDWLGGEPVRTWLLVRAPDTVFGPMLASEPAVTFFAYSGLAFDLTIALWLLLPRTRMVAVAGVAVFHLLNEYLFEVGLLPFFMIVMVVIFLPYDMFAGLRRTELPDREPRLPRGALLALASVWVVWQLIFPLRHLAYPGDGRWTYEGQRFSWWFRHATLANDVDMWVENNESGARVEVHPPDYLAPHQYSVFSDPHLVVQLAHKIKARDYANDNVSIRADVRGSLNQRPWQQLVPPEVNLLDQPIGAFVHHPWIVPLGEQLRPAP